MSLVIVSNQSRISVWWTIITAPLAICMISIGLAFVLEREYGLNRYILPATVYISIFIRYVVGVIHWTISEVALDEDSSKVVVKLMRYQWYPDQFTIPHNCFTFQAGNGERSFNFQTVNYGQITTSASIDHDGHVHNKSLSFLLNIEYYDEHDFLVLMRELNIRSNNTQRSKKRLAILIQENIDKLLARNAEKLGSPHS